MSMKKLIYILLFIPLFLQAQNVQFYLTNKGDSIFCSKIEMATYEQSCKGVLAHTRDSVILLSPSRTVLYQRGKEIFVSGKFENKAFDSLLFYKIEENGKLFKLYSCHINGEKRFYLLEKKNESLAEVTPKYFEKNLPKRLRKNKDLYTKLKEKKYCIDQLPAVIHEANSRDFVAETSADFYRDPIKKIPIYVGAYDPEGKGGSNQKGRSGQLNNNASEKQYNNSADEDDHAVESDFVEEERTVKKGEGKEEKNSAKRSTRIRKSGDNDWLFVNAGLHTGLDYLSNGYFHQGVPIGLNIGGDFSVGLFQRYLRVGISGNRTAIPYVNRGNIIYSNYGLNAQLYISPYFYLSASYGPNRILYSVYPNSKVDDCNCVKQPNGIKDYRTSFWAINSYISKTNAFTFGIGVQTGDSPFLKIFNDVQIQLSKIPAEFSGSTTNIAFLQNQGINIVNPGKQEVWMISLKLGLRVWEE